MENLVEKMSKYQYGRVIWNLFIPTTKPFANVRLLEKTDDWGFTAHWLSNFNLDWDFSSELMQFKADLYLDIVDKIERNDYREKNWLVEIK